MTLPLCSTDRTADATAAGLIPQTRTSARAAWHAVAAMLISAGLIGCGPSQMKPPEAPVQKAGTAGHDEHAGHDHGHPHVEKGPHGGTIIVVAGHHAHLELVLDQATGDLKAYVLNEEASKPSAFEQEELVVGFIPEDHHDEKGEHKDHKEEKKADELSDIEEVKLKATATADGKSSEFAGQSDKLKGVKDFSGLLMSVKLEGKEYKEVKFDFPEGNEHLPH